MPFLENHGAKIYWDEEGEGEPILLITGAGWSAQMWHRTRPAIAAQYRTIALDNRGVGRSETPAGPYSVELMAADASAVLDAAGVRTAHVFGMSMGGMIAQELALRYSSRVRSLILGCTTCGGYHACRPQLEVVEILRDPHMTPDRATQALLPFIYHPGTPRERIDEDLVINGRQFFRLEGFRAQLRGIISWEAYSRLPQLSVPALVVHGESDRLIPPGNAKLISSRIPNAVLVTIPNASHIFTTDQPQLSHWAILQFLAAQADHCSKRS